MSDDKDYMREYMRKYRKKHKQLQYYTKKGKPAAKAHKPYIANCLSEELKNKEEQNYYIQQFPRPFVGNI